MCTASGRARERGETYGQGCERKTRKRLQRRKKKVTSGYNMAMG